MANVLKIKRGSGNPGSGLQAYELGWDTSTNSLYIGNGVGSTLIANAFGDYISLDSNGDLSLSNNLTVHGNTVLGDSSEDSAVIRGTVTLSDIGSLTTILGDLDIDSDVQIGGTLDVTGATTITGLASLDGGIDVNGASFTVGTNGNIVTTGDLTVNGNTILGDAGTDTTTIRGTVTLSDSDRNTNIKGTLNVDKAVTLDTTLGVTGNTTLGDSDTTNTINGIVNIGSAARMTTVKGTLNVDQAVTFDTTLGVTGNTTLGVNSANTNTIYGTVNLSNIGQTTTVKGDLQVDSDAQINGTLGVNGVATFSDEVVANSLDINSNLTIDSDGNIATAGGVTIGGNLTVNGTMTYVNTTITELSDPVMALGGYLNDANDRGIEFKWKDSDAGDSDLGFFGWEKLTNRFTFIPSATRTDSDNGPYSGITGDVEFGNIYQPQTDDVYASGGTVLNASAKWNLNYKKFKDGIENAQTDEILQYNGTAFIATTSPSGLTIDCGSY